MPRQQHFRGDVARVRPDERGGQILPALFLAGGLHEGDRAITLGENTTSEDVRRDSHCE
jgi:hypothetical protein